MRRLVILVVALTMLPASAVWATDLDEILERTRSAEFSAEQIVSCSTPDGAQNAFVQLVQVGGDLNVSSKARHGLQVFAGSGEWTLTRPDGLVTGATVEAGRDVEDELYTVEDGSRLRFLERSAQAYRLERDGVLRAELVVDDETGALVQAVTFTADGEIYCERRFVSIDSTVPDLTPVASVDRAVNEQVQDSHLPSEVAGFQRLDHYVDETGFTFAYYSDGFFSFALFETEVRVDLPGADDVQFETGIYSRVFSAGQVSYVWETNSGGVALIGDLPPDLHQEILAEMPIPDNRGFIRRWWRALFG